MRPATPSATYRRLHLTSDRDGPAQLTVIGTLAGHAGGGVAVLARRRSDRTEIRTPATAGDVGFRAVLDLGRLVPAAGSAQVWDLYLLPGPGGAPLRIAAPEPEMADRHRVLRYPARQIAAGGSLWRVGPYVTLDGRLSVSAKPVPAGQPARSAPTPARRRGGEAARAALRRLPAPLRSGLRRGRAALRRSIAGAATLGVRVALGAAAARSGGGASGPVGGEPRSRIFLLVMTAYGMGGTIRTTLTLAGELARDFDVEIVSVLRHREKPFFDFPPGVRVTVMIDRTQPDAPAGRRTAGCRATVRRHLRRSPSRLVHAEDFAWSGCSLETDLALLRWLRSLPPSVLVTTRPAWNLLAARYAPRRVITVGQEHQHFNAHRPGLAQAIARHYAGLDAVVALTTADEADYRRLVGHRTTVARIPNALPKLPPLPATPRRKVVLAAGRLTRQKGFDLLLEAFESVAEAEPDWTLRIYGGGPQAAELRRLIEARELYNSVFLMGPTDHLAAEMARASLFALSSRYEGFGMVIIEAMSSGLPVVSFECPNGPADILTQAVDGLLVPNGDVPAFGAALLALIRDEDARDRSARAGRRTVRRYTPELVGGQWRDLLANLGVHPQP